MENVITNPTDFTNGSVNDIINFFRFEYLDAVDLDDDPNKGQFYCGITGDISANLQRHNVKGYTACALCDSFETASEVECRLGEMGFDIGHPNHEGNGGDENSKIVYMIKKTESFNA